MSSHPVAAASGGSLQTGSGVQVTPEMYRVTGGGWGELGISFLVRRMLYNDALQKKQPQKLMHNILSN